MHVHTDAELTISSFSLHIPSRCSTCELPGPCLCDPMAAAVRQSSHGFRHTSNSYAKAVGDNRHQGGRSREPAPWSCHNIIFGAATNTGRACPLNVSASCMVIRVHSCPDSGIVSVRAQNLFTQSKRTESICWEREVSWFALRPAVKSFFATHAYYGKIQRRQHHRDGRHVWTCIRWKECMLTSIYRL